MKDYHDRYIPAPSNGVVAVKVKYRDENMTIRVESNIDQFSESDLRDAVARCDKKKMKITRLLGYFKLYDGEELFTGSESLIEIKIQYSPLAWELANEDFTPRISYLAREGNEWAENWVELIDGEDGTNIEKIPPSNGDPNYYLVITTKYLPDPLIGGC